MRTSGGQLESDTFLGVSFGDQRGVRHLHREDAHRQSPAQSTVSLSSCPVRIGVVSRPRLHRVPPPPAEMRRKGSDCATAILE